MCADYMFCNVFFLDKNNMHDFVPICFSFCMKGLKALGHIYL